MKTIGVKVEEIKSSPLKAAPNGFEPTSPEARAAIEAMVMDSYAWFRGWCRTAASSTRRRSQRVADGRVFTGRQAIELKLVDELGNERTAVAWLAKEKEHRTPRRRCATGSCKTRFSDLPFLHLGGGGRCSTRVGLGSLARRIEASGRGPGDRAAQS